MISLKEKYAPEIELMLKDARANFEEAEDEMILRGKDVKEWKETVEKLKSTTQISHKHFFKVSMEVFKLAFSKNLEPEKVNKAISFCHMYKIAAEQLPMAEGALREAKERLADAEEKFNDASNALINISYFT